MPRRSASTFHGRSEECAMLSREENELMCRVGPGTLMGKTLRRYWHPLCLSAELPHPDCPPLRLRLLGEKLVAFRDSEGKVGLLNEYCPHRGVSLALGRVRTAGSAASTTAGSSRWTA